VAEQLAGAQVWGGGAQGVAGVVTVADLARLLRQLRRRQARQRGETTLTYRELAAKTGWSRGIIGEYFTGNVLPPTDRFDVLIQLLGATTAEQGRLATARDRVEEYRAAGELVKPRVDELGPGSGHRVVSTQVQGFAEVVGREDELISLRVGFTDTQRPSRPVLRVLTGLGGVGKTTLARAYAQRYQDQYELVWWVRAEDPDAVPEEFRALLDILAPQYAERTHDPVQALHAVLANRTKPWLLVIDNVAEPKALRGLLPAAGTGDVLITSRAGNWPNRRITLPVQPLTQPHAIRLVTALSGDPDQTTAVLLAQELGCLPLALAQAGCYVAHNAFDLASYLALYRRHRAELHQHGDAPDYPATVATTWQLAFDQLTPLARALLNLLAWYASDAIPLDRLLTTDTDHLPLPEQIETLLRPLLADELCQHRVVTELVFYGLLTRAEPPGSVTVHRLVQAVTADQLTASNHHNAWIIAAATLLDAACPRWHANSGPKWLGGRVAITIWQSLQTHVRTMIEHLSPDQVVSLNLRDLLAEWIGWTGDFIRARKLAAAVAKDMSRVLGPDHQYTLAVRLNLAYWTGEAGDVVSAREAAAAVAEDMSRVLGGNHRLTFFARGNVCRWTALSGEAGQARELAAAIVCDLLEVFGADDPDTLNGQAHLARFTGEAGDVARARELAAAVVENDNRVLGPGHRQTLAARADLGRWTAEDGDVTQARELAAALVEDDKRVLGPDHRHTLLARAHLALWTGEAGDVVRARELAAALVEDDKRVLGPDHRYTLLARAHLARWTGEAADMVGAQELATTVMEDMVRILGPDHRDTRAAQTHLAPRATK
jgi:Helix-turn-helix domain/NB-ARC domain/Tetratricopeptide repeat